MFVKRYKTLFSIKMVKCKIVCLFTFAYMLHNNDQFGAHNNYVDETTSNFDGWKPLSRLKNINKKVSYLTE